MSSILAGSVKSRSSPALFLRQGDVNERIFYEGIFTKESLRRNLYEEFFFKGIYTKEGIHMHIILHQPEIPANTGNIGRTCVATNTGLHLIEPLGFRINEKELKRAGMDYWDKLDVTRYVNYADFREKHPGAVIWMATTKAHRSYTDVSFSPDDYIMFGRESAGIPEEILAEDEEHCIRIPMGENIRSLNLSNSVAIVLYEALRQQDFAGLQLKGELHRLSYRSE